MNDKTLENVRKIQEECSDNVNLVGTILETDDKLGNLKVQKAAQEMELDERKMRLEEDKLKFEKAKHKLEVEKFNHQKKQSKSENRIKWGSIIGTFLGIAVPVTVKLLVQRKYSKEGYALEGLGQMVTSQTNKALIKDGLTPKI